jgi:hypothetical protein
MACDYIYTLEAEHGERLKWIEDNKAHCVQGTDDDNVNHPAHYTQHKSGIECIQVTEYMNFLLGNAMKYIWRADLKNGVEDLKKAIWYINREIVNRQIELRGKEIEQR